MPKTCPPANSGGTNAVLDSGVFTNTPCATKRICSVARTTSISIPSNMDYATMSAIGRFIVSPLCSGWVAAVKLGRKKRNGGNEFWRVNVIKTTHRVRGCATHPNSGLKASCGPQLTIHSTNLIKSHQTNYLYFYRYWHNTILLEFLL